jgi:hypothetical protein
MRIKYRAAGGLFLRLASCSLVASLALGLSLSLSSCAPKKPGARPGASAAAKPGPQQPPPPPGGPNGAPPQPQTAAKPGAASTASTQSAAPLSAPIRAFGLGLDTPPRIAWDFSLGPLQPLSPGKGEVAEVLKVAQAFLDGMAIGRVDPQLLLPSAREALGYLIADQAGASSQGASSSSADRGSRYRLGAIVLRDDGASLKLRLGSVSASSQEGAAQATREEGLLSLRKVADSWYVEGLALDQRSGALAFDPGAFEKAGYGD